MTGIQTERLDLRLVSLAGLAATAAKNRAGTRRILGKVPDVWFEEAWVAELRLKQCEDDPAYGPWSIRAITLRETGEVVGNMNCHHVPMPFVLRGDTVMAVELGYSIFEPWRRRGFALEAIRGFAGWAALQGLEALVLSVSPENTASLRLAAKLNAEKIGSKVDEINGPEDIYFARI